MNMLNVASNSESDVTKSRYRKTNLAKSLELSVYGRKKEKKRKLSSNHFTVVISTSCV